MKWLFPVALLFSVSCGTTKISDVIPKVENVAIDCTEGAVHDTAVGILDDVATALADQNWIGLLVDLGKRFTSDAVDCAVREVFGQAQRNAMASRDPLEQTKAARAQQWLTERGR